MSGPITLYSSYTTRPHFFVETHQQELTELIYFVRPVGATEVLHARQYREQLKARRTEACEDASVSNIDFKQREITRFVSSCNAASGAPAVEITAARFRFNHVIGVLGSRTASRHVTGATVRTMTGFAPGFQYQFLAEHGKRKPVGALLIGIGVHRMRATYSNRTVQPTSQSVQGVERTRSGSMSATVVEVSTEMRFRMMQSNWRPFIGVEAATLLPFNYSASFETRTEPLPTSDRNFSPYETKTNAQDWDTHQYAAGAGLGIEGPRFGGRFGFLYGFPTLTVENTIPRLLDFELQLFITL